MSAAQNRKNKRDGCRCGCGEVPAGWGAEYVKGHRPLVPVADRLQAKLVETPAGCQEFTGHRMSNGYGQIGTGEGKKIATTHRVAYEIAHGPIPDGLVVRHRCDNRACCNPDHLELGTQADNVQDAIDRGRIARGDMLPAYRLTSDQVREIRERHDPAAHPSRRRGNQMRSNTPELAAEFGISESYLRQLVRREERKDVE